jgi:PKD repeat protein
VLGSDGTIYITNIALDPNGDLKWTASTGTSTIHTPAIGSDGTLYLSNASNYVNAINPDGTIKWSYLIGGGAYGQGYISAGCPSIGSDGTIYIASYGKNLNALNPDGSLKWTTSTSTYVYNSGSAIGTDGTIYIISGTTPYAFYPNGTVKWTSSAFMSVAPGKASYSIPVIGPDGTIYITINGGKNLTALNPDGSLDWSYNMGSDYGQGSPAIASDGTIYFTNFGDGNIYALNPDGTKKWSYSTGKTGTTVYSTPAIGADGIIYVGFSDNKIYALNPDGSLHWIYITGGQITGAPAIGSDGTLYVQSKDTYLYAFRDPFKYTADQTKGSVPLTVKFNATSTSTDPALEWHWEFGDGSTSAEQNPSHTYTAVGSYNITLIVTYSTGDVSVTRTGFITVNSSGNVPVASFTASPTTGATPLTVTFTDASSNAPTSWAWNFGDGSSSAVQNPVYTYTTPGIFTVSLNATNAAGSNTTTKTGYISVSGNPTDRAQLILSDASLYQDTATQLPIRISNITSGTGISFDLAYDPAVIRVNEITLNQSYASGSNLVINQTDGLIRLSLTSTDGINIGSLVPVFLLNTTSTGAVGSQTPLTLTSAMWSDTTFNKRQFDTVNGSALVYRHRGDLNGNTEVDIGDTAKTAYMVVKKTPDLIPDADFNNNGRIDVGDATKIAWYLIGKILEL